MSSRERHRWEELERHLLPAEELPESLEAQLVRPSPVGLWSFWALLLALGAALLWAALAELEVTVRCRGYLRSAVPPQVFHSPYDGIVEAVLVELHQRVRRGDTLLRLRDSELRLRLETLQQEFEHQSQLFAELSTLLRLLPVGGTPAEILHQLPPPTRWRTPLVRSLADLIRKDIQLFARQYEAIAKRWERTAALHEKQFASAEEFESATAELRLQELRVLQYLQSRQQELEHQRDALDHRLQELRQQLGVLQEQLQKTALVANVDGQITQLTVQKPGLYVAAGQELLTITPEARLEAELLISPQDITLVRPGQRVRYSIAGLPPGQWEPLWGTVESVAEDVSAEGAVLSYRVRASVDTTILRMQLRSARAPQVQLRKGLPLEAAIHIGRKPVIAWLFDRSRHLWQELAL